MPLQELGANALHGRRGESGYPTTTRQGLLGAGVKAFGDGSGATPAELHAKHWRSVARAFPAAIAFLHGPHRHWSS